MRADGLHRVSELNEADLYDIEQLAVICNAHDDARLRLNREMLATRPQGQTRDWLLYANGALIGFLAVFAFGLDEAELVGMVHPDQRRQGHFTTLYEAARGDCQARGFGRLLVLTEHDQRPGQAFIAQIGGSFDHAEYAMELADVPPLAARHANLTLRAATEADAAPLTRILAAAFGEEEEDPADFARSIASNPHRQWLVALAGDSPIATLGLVGDAAETAIYGFAVLPEWQGRGYGRQILGQTVADLLADGPRHIVLEVATDNARALGLYTSCGFRQITAYDYYAVPLGASPK